MFATDSEIDLERIVYDQDYRRLQIARLLHEQHHSDPHFNHPHQESGTDQDEELSIPPFNLPLGLSHEATESLP
ncbi:MAG: hypothetical protein QM537_02865 [Candidatus Symbiobacter sp.]|nr:hypothetical protein [Candidatus Symbiobacter sp.]